MTTTELLKELSKPLKIEDVDFRVQSINKGGYATILAYKDARVDMNRLDAVCGVNWQDDYKLIDGQLFCGIAIKVETDWIWRWDVGSESFTEKVKGRASDAFKRAGFRWGIGRELYDYPLINIKLNPHEFTIQPNGKAKQTWNLKLREWKWEASFKGNKIISLIAIDCSGKVRYKSNQESTAMTQSKTTTKKPLKWLKVMDSQKNFTAAWLNLLAAINDKRITSIEKIKEHYQLTEEVENKIVELLNY